MLGKLKWVIAIAALCASTSFAGVLCTETGDGCIADVFGGQFLPVGQSLIVASDGESSFDPFGAGFDTSDGIQFNGFNQFGVFWTSVGSPAWVQIAGGDGTWVLPADLTAFGCGTENEPTCEPLGEWNANDGVSWIQSVLGTYTMLDEDGAVGDIIVLSNSGPGGSAHVTFQSDPIPTPEPATMLLLGAGLIGIGYRYSRKRAA